MPAKTLEKTLESFASHQVGPQNATDMARNIPWTFLAPIHRQLGRNFGVLGEDKIIATFHDVTLGRNLRCSSSKSFMH